MIGYLNFVTVSPERCSECGKDLPAGYHGYITVSIHYRDKMEVIDTVMCQECLNKELVVSDG